ncbi:MAG: hypothetical protein GF364_06265 [Candidatus Lokiarchaeota archaeon]|nr:hypothetical protein [Candidatus Lokiarchaeota archaeon]
MHADLIEWNIGHRLIEGNNMVIDCETDKGMLCIMGYYYQGTGKIYQLVFASPVDAALFRTSDLFESLIPEGFKIYSYYAAHEQELLDLDPAQMGELQPIPRVQKERFIRIGSLTRTTGRELPSYDGSHETRSKYLAHNLSCLCKEILLLMDHIDPKPHLRMYHPNFLKELEEKMKRASL